MNDLRRARSGGLANPARSTHGRETCLIMDDLQRFGGGRTGEGMRGRRSGKKSQASQTSSMKTKTIRLEAPGYSSLWLAMILISSLSVFSQPTLNILPSENQFILFWPATATNYVLQCSADLTMTNWTLASDAVPTTYGTDTAVIVSNTASARYFRLSQISTTTPDGMMLIPAGTFTMGDTLDGMTDAVPVTVNLSAFYMDTNMVTYGLWQTVYNWATSHGYSFDNAGYGKAANYPVQKLDWYDCVKWCNARSEMAGMTPAYYTDASQTVVFRSGDLDLSNLCVNWDAGYRLPTEAEWEVRARRDERSTISLGGHD